jgi:hypothetical protein
MRRATRSVFCLLAASLAACGGGGGSSGQVQQSLAEVRPAQESVYIDWLASQEIACAAPDLGDVTRAPAQTQGLIWPLYPKGDTRVDAITGYAIEVASGFPQGGVLQLRRGEEILFQEAKPFEPTTRLVFGTFPAHVREHVETSDSLVWGIYFPDEPRRNVTVRVRVVKKPAAERALERIVAQPRGPEVTDLLLALGRNQVLLNNSLHGEALSGFLDITSSDPTVGEAWTRVAECLRRLDLEDAPLFVDARARSANLTSKSSKGWNRGSGTGLDATLPSSNGSIATQELPRARRESPSGADVRRAAQGHLDALRRLAGARAEQAARDARDAQAALAKARQQLADAQAAAASAVEAARAQARAEAETALRREAEARARAGQADERETRLREERERIEEMARRGLPPHLREREQQLQAMSAYAAGLRTEANAMAAAAAELSAVADAAEGRGDPEASELRARADRALAHAAERSAEADAAQQRVQELSDTIPPPLRR